MMVRFATTCDRCGKRSNEYTAWPSCRACMEDTCPECAKGGTLVEGDGERADTVVCRVCAEQGEG
jgi:hypothetical protein